MKKAMALTALMLLTACDYVARKDVRTERDDRAYRAAMDDYRAGRMDAAVTGLEKAVRNDPANASARFQLACLQQDVKRDFLSAYCNYREFLQQQPESDRAKLARERLRLCMKEVAGELSAKQGCDSSGASSRELDVVRAELKASKARIAEIEKALAASRERERVLSAERDRLLAAIKGEDEAVDESVRAAFTEKDLLEDAEDGEEPGQIDLAKKVLAEEEDETSTSSSLIPVSTAGKAAVRKDKGGRAPDKDAQKKVPDRPKTYVVEEGDTLYGVAKRFYGSIQAWKSIREANKALISTDNRLKAGDTIVLP